MIVLTPHTDKKRILFHALFWSIWIGGFTLIQSFGYGLEDYKAWMFYYMTTLPLFMVHTYVIAYWLVPGFFFRNRYFVFAGFIIVLLILFSIIELILSNEVIWKIVKPQNLQHGNYLNWQNVLINGLGNEYIIIVFLAIKVVRFHDSKLIEKTALENEKLSVEIELLRYQSYPRFVLNVMDRLEKLAVNGSSPTSEMIIRLSNLLSYMIETRKTEKILLYKEIEMIKAYTEIQRMKLSRDLKMNLMVKGEMKRIQIPPFLFFQIIEEGFFVMESGPENSEYSVSIIAEQSLVRFSMVLWNPQLFDTRFNPLVLENCHKYLSYFYSGNHKVISNFEVNFVEITIEIYT